MSIIAFRTDRELETKLEQAAARSRRTKTDVIREALEFYLQNEHLAKRNVPKVRCLADALKPDIGTWDGPATASAETGKQLGDILFEKYGTGRV